MVGKKSYKKHKGGDPTVPEKVGIFGALKAKGDELSAKVQGTLQNGEGFLNSAHANIVAKASDLKIKAGEQLDAAAQQVRDYQGVARGQLTLKPGQNVVPAPGQNGGRKINKRSRSKRSRSKRSSKRSSSKTKKRVRFSFKRSKSKRSKSKRSKSKRSKSKRRKH
jgi:hypothetical protein